MSEEDERAHGQTVIKWAHRLMITKGYGWSKAMDKAATYAGESKPTKGKSKTGR